MKKIILAFLLLMVLDIANAQCADEANIVSFTFNGAIYEIVKENNSWVDAASCAVERGGYLVEINSQEEQDTVFSSLNLAGINTDNTIAPDGGGAAYIWLGANDIATEGAWIWDGDNNGEGIQFWEGDWNGTPVNDLYNNWGGEPDNWNNQDGLGMALTSWPYGVPGQWNDVDDGNTLYYVIEYNSNVGLIKLNDKNIHIYPNPAQNVLYFEKNKEYQLKQLSIINNLGVVCMEIAYNDMESLNISELSSGIYFVNMTLLNNEVIIKKIIKE